MKIEIYPHPLIDLREIDWENDKADIINGINHIFNIGENVLKYHFEKNYYISKIEKKNNSLFCEISIK